MSNFYTKVYFEQYAKLSLALLYDKKYSALQKNERPDWQSKDLEIGLEVTQGISKYQGMVNAISQTYGNDTPPEYIIESLQNDLAAHNTFYDLSESEPDNLCLHIRNAYIKKTKKLNNHYITYSSNQLYIFTFQSMLVKADIQQCMRIDLAPYDINFDITFLNCQDKIYVCDFAACRIMDFVEIDHDTQLTLKRTALESSHRA